MKRVCKHCGLTIVEPRISFEDGIAIGKLLCCKCERILRTIIINEIELTRYDHSRIYKILEEYKVK